MEQMTGSRLHDWLNPASIRLKRSLERSPHMRLLALLGINLLGCAFMLAAPATLGLTAAGAIYLASHTGGPLDWFFVACLAAIASGAAWLSLQLLQVNPRAPDGVRLRESDAPELFAMLERRVGHFKSRPVASTILTTDAELSLRWTPTRAIPLFHRRTLCVGAPLQFFISQKQFRLALAGAVAVSAGMQNSLRGRLAQACQDWLCIAKALESCPDYLRHLYSRPLNRLIELNMAFNAELLAENEQLQARWIFDNSDEQSTAGYLGGKVVAAAYLEHQYWPMVLKAAEKCETPVIRPFSHFAILLDRTLDREGARRWLLSAQVSNDIRQHGVRDQLASLGIEQLDWVGIPVHSAITTVFIDHSVLHELDRHWQKSIAETWTRRHRAYQRDRDRFDRLHRSATGNNLRGKAAARYLKLASRFLGPQQAAEACMTINAANQSDASLRFACGRELLKSGFIREGCAILQRAAEMDSSLSHQAHALINQHAHLLSGRQDSRPVRALRSA